jgi:hypothetical protein
MISLQRGSTFRDLACFHFAIVTMRYARAIEESKLNREGE